MIGLIVANKRHEDFAAVFFTSASPFRYQAYDLAVSTPSFSEAKDHLREIM